MNKLARAVTKWTKSCDKRLARLISYMHHTCEFRQYCHVGNTAQQCRMDYFKILILQETWKTQNRLRGRLLCNLGSQTFVPISWMCEKQSSVSHSSTEAELISLDAGLRMDGIPALHLWELVIEVFHSPELNQIKPKIKHDETRCVIPHQTSTPKTKLKTQPSTTILS